MARSKVLSLINPAKTCSPNDLLVSIVPSLVHEDNTLRFGGQLHNRNCQCRVASGAQVRAHVIAGVGAPRGKEHIGLGYGRRAVRNDGHQEDREHKQNNEMNTRTSNRHVPNCTVPCPQTRHDAGHGHGHGHGHGPGHGDHHHRHHNHHCTAQLQAAASPARAARKPAAAASRSPTDRLLLRLHSSSPAPA